MKPMKTLVLGASVVAIGLGVAGTAHAANSGVSDHVKKVEIEFPGMAAIVHVKNYSTDKLASKVKLQTIENALGFEVGGLLQCAKDKDVKDDGSNVYFGPLAMQGDDVNTGATLDEEPFTVSRSTWAPVGSGNEYITEYYPAELYEVLLSKVKNGHPALRVDPIAEVEKAAQDFVSKGGTLADFYKQDHTIVLKRPISLGGWCKHTKTQKRTGGFATMDHTIQIEYEGDPAVYTPALNPKLGGALGGEGMKKGVEVNYSLKSATFQPNMPNYSGKCPPDQNPKIRINFEGAGDKEGVVDIMVVPESSQYNTSGFEGYAKSAGIANNPKNGGSHVDITFPLKQMLDEESFSFMSLPNQTTNHNMRIKARYRNFDNNKNSAWSEWKDYGTATFKHTCKPQTAVPLGGNGAKFNNNNGGSKPSLDKAIQPIEQKKPARASN